MDIRDGDYILGFWQIWGPMMEVLATVLHRFGQPENEWHFEIRNRLRMDDELDPFLSKDKKSFATMKFLGTEDAAIAEMRRVMKEMEATIRALDQLCNYSPEDRNSEELLVRSADMEVIMEQGFRKLSNVHIIELSKEEAKERGLEEPPTTEH